MIVDKALRPLVDLLGDLEEGAQCRFDPELHSGPDAFTTEPWRARQAREDAAKQVCETCPVWASCLEYALRLMPAWGVWAGMTAEEISALALSTRTDEAELAEVA